MTTTIAVGIDGATPVRLRIDNVTAFENYQTSRRDYALTADQVTQLLDRWAEATTYRGYMSFEGHHDAGPIWVLSFLTSPERTAPYLDEWEAMSDDFDLPRGQWWALSDCPLKLHVVELLADPDTRKPIDLPGLEWSFSGNDVVLSLSESEAVRLIKRLATMHNLAVRILDRDDIGLAIDRRDWGAPPLDEEIRDELLAAVMASDEWRELSDPSDADMNLLQRAIDAAKE